jgi:two-component system response regulator HydG
MDFPLSVSDIPPPEKESAREELSVDLPLEEVEKATILKTLESAGGNKSETARRLGITRRTLHKKLKKYGVM